MINDKKWGFRENLILRVQYLFSVAILLNCLADSTFYWKENDQRKYFLGFVSKLSLNFPMKIFLNRFQRSFILCKLRN